MQKNIISVVSVLLAAVAFAGCDTCENDEPPANQLSFFLVSRTNQNLIGRMAGQYAPDSVQITLLGEAFDFKVASDPLFGSGNVVILYTGRQFVGLPNARLLMRLNPTDVDTIDVSYTREKGRCADVIKYNSVVFNGRQMEMNTNGYYIFIK
jgi:hypothetical protein